MGEFLSCCSSFMSRQLCWYNYLCGRCPSKIKVHFVSLGQFEGHSKINSADTKSSRSSRLNTWNHPLFQQCGGREKEKGGGDQRNLHVVILIFQFCIGLLEETCCSENFINSYFWASAVELIAFFFSHCAISEELTFPTPLSNWAVLWSPCFLSGIKPILGLVWFLIWLHGWC